jgi:hypothetical protein
MFKDRVAEIKKQYTRLEGELALLQSQMEMQCRRDLEAALPGHTFKVYAHTNCGQDGNEFEYLDSMELHIDNVDGIIYDVSGKGFPNDLASGVFVKAPIPLEELRKVANALATKYGLYVRVRIDDAKRFGFKDK